MEILVSGATGLVGSHFVTVAQSRGHSCAALTRRPRTDSDVGWDPASGQLNVQQLGAYDAVVHLAGDNIAKGRWTKKKKRLMWWIEKTPSTF